MRVFVFIYIRLTLGHRQSLTDYTVANGRINNEWLIRRDLEDFIV